MFAANKDKLFYLTLAAISANNFTVEEIQTTNGYIIFTGAGNKYLATVAEIDDMNFGLRIVKHVKSNAIVVVKDGKTLGVGAGQMNRIGSAEIALKQAHANGVTEGLVLASDAFFPFDDCVTLAHQMGVTAIVQPGGSVRDEDSVKKANECGIAMLFSGMRHFKH